ncbi:hypothetical protein [Aquimarina sp. 433]
MIIKGSSQLLKCIYFWIIIAIIFSCKNAKTEDKNVVVEVTANTKKENILENKENNSSSIQIAKSIFNDIISIDEKAKDSLLLFNKYKFNISQQKNLISLNFRECLIFSNQQYFNDKFDLKETNVWYEERLEHTNLFYSDHNNKHIIVLDFLKATTFKKCNISKGNDLILDAIRIFKKEKYNEISKKSNSPFYSYKM